MSFELRVRSAWGGLGDRVRNNLGARVALGVGLPILLVLCALSIERYWRERNLLQAQARLAAAQLGRVLVGGLRPALLANNTPLVRQALGDIRRQQTIDRAQIVDPQGQAWVDSGPVPAAVVHQSARRAATRATGSPPAAVVTSDKESVRVAVPIANEPECAAGHVAGGTLERAPGGHSHAHSSAKCLARPGSDLGIWLGLTLIVGAGPCGLLHRLVVKRIITFRGPPAAYVAGDFGARLPAAGPFDEIGRLAGTFNHMAEQPESHVHDERARSDQSHQAILAERERIARELHDGLRQVLGYVQTKATAIRLLLRRRQFQSAEAQNKAIGQAMSRSENTIVPHQEHPSKAGRAQPYRSRRLRRAHRLDQDSAPSVRRTLATAMSRGHARQHALAILHRVAPNPSR